MTRIIDVSAGDVDYATAQASEQSGKSLATTTWQVGFGSRTERPEVWRAADEVETITDSVVKVHMLIDATTTRGPGQYLWVRDIDDPVRRAWPVIDEDYDIR